MPLKPGLILCLLLTTLTGYVQPRYRVYAVRFASVDHKYPVSDWVDKGPTTDSVTIDFMIWVIKGDNGKTILVDAGFRAGMEEKTDLRPYTYQRPDWALNKLGIQATDITDIIISHPHWDHIDGLPLFPNAHLWMQKEDYNYYVGAAWQKGGNTDGFKKQEVHMLVDNNLNGRLTLVDGDNKEIIPGITVYTGSRHTFDSQFAVVQTGASKILLASDNCWTYYSLEHMLPPPQGGTFDVAAYLRSLQRMKTLVSDPKYIIPGHDSQIFNRWPTVASGIVEIK